MRNSSSSDRRSPPPQRSSTRGFLRGLTVVLVIAMIALLGGGIWALGRSDFGLAFTMLVAGAGVTFVLLAITLVTMRRPRL